MWENFNIYWLFFCEKTINIKLIVNLCEIGLYGQSLGILVGLYHWPDIGPTLKLSILWQWANATPMCWCNVAPMSKITLSNVIFWNWAHINDNSLSTLDQYKLAIGEAVWNWIRERQAAATLCLLDIHVCFALMCMLHTQVVNTKRRTNLIIILSFENFLLMI